MNSHSYPTHSFDEIIRSIFGDRVLKDREGSRRTTPITSALLNENEKTFKKNLVARLKRLHSHYSDHPCLPELVVLVRNLANLSLWQGAFAELVALDYFNYPLLDHASFLYTPVFINPDTRPFCLLGMEPGAGNGSTLDGEFRDHGVCYDAKVLLDTRSDILASLHARVKSQFPDRYLSIVSEFQPDRHPRDLGKHVETIEVELIEAICKEPGIRYLRSRVVTGLEHWLSWEPGWQLTGYSYSSYRHAMEFYREVFKDCRQFTTDRPFVLVYVIFPKYNAVVTDFRNMNAEFFRAVARRAFMAHRADTRPVSSLFSHSEKPKRLPQATIAKASRALSAILFLEDVTTTLSDENKSNAIGYLYSNPNAEWKLTRPRFWDYAVCDLKLNVNDTLEYDNY